MKLLSRSSMIAVLLSMFANNSYADNQPYSVDIYGTNRITNKQLAEKFKNEFTIIANNFNSGVYNHSKNESDKMANALYDVIKSLQSTHHYAYVNISPFIYTKTPTIYFTVDVVEKTDKKRLSSFLPKPTQTISDPHHLIATWIEYENVGFNQAFVENDLSNFKNCPAHHCIYGFEHPILAKYAHSFDSAEQYKSNLVDVLRHDKDETKRAAAAFVLAYIKSSQELVDLLVPSVYDSNPGVRNNALRVMMSALHNNHHLHVPMKPIFDAVNFPSASDRNKSLYVVVELANSPKNVAIIKNKLGKQLIANLKLYQPTNHDPAYLILTKISGKHYADRDYQSWEKWLGLK